MSDFQAIAELDGREQIRAWGDRVPDLVDFLVQNTHPGAIRLAGSPPSAAEEARGDQE